MAILRLSIAAALTSLARGSVPRVRFASRRCMSPRRALSIGGYDSFLGNKALHLRGGGNQEPTTGATRYLTTSTKASPMNSGTEYVTLANPAPGSPFHLALPVHDLEVAKIFYGNVLGCEEGRSSEKWQDYSLHGHQIVCHWAGNDYRCKDYFNPVDGDEIPVPHFGVAMTEEEFHVMADRLKEAGIKFIVEPHLRFKGQPGEQWTMFFKDPSGNNLEFKAMTTIENLFAKYNVVD